MLKFNYKFKDFNYGPEVEGVLKKKIDRLYPLLKTASSDSYVLDLLVAKNPKKEEYETRLTLKISGKTFYAKKSADALEKSLLRAVDDIKAELEKAKEKSHFWEQNPEKISSHLAE